MIYLCPHIEHIPQDELDKVFAALPSAERAHIESTAAPGLRRQRLAARWVLQRLLMDEFGLSAIPAVARTRLGKPVFIGEQDGVFFNLAHSGGCAAAIAAPTAAGIDVECLRGDIPRGAMHRSFTAAEQSHISSPEDFFAHWTRKESLLKAMGQSVNQMRDHSLPVGRPRFAYAGDHFLCGREGDIFWAGCQKEKEPVFRLL